MNQEHNKAIEELLANNICEKNIDGELKPTSDFLVWYYGYLIHEITELGLNDWEEIDIDERISDDEEVTLTKRDLIEDCIGNQISVWTAQTIDGKTYASILDSREHAKIIYNLIEEIEERLTDVSMQKTRDRTKK